MEHKKRRYLDDETCSESVLFELTHHDNWNAVADFENFLNVFDKLPPRTRLVVDFKMTGSTNKEIAKMLLISETTVRWHLAQAKKDFLHSIIK